MKSHASESRDKIAGMTWHLVLGLGLVVVVWLVCVAILRRSVLLKEADNADNADEGN